MRDISRYLSVALVAIVASLATLFLARGLPREEPAHGGRLHEIMHEKLELNADQLRKIDVLESGFAETREKLEAELAAANRDLAAAVANEHAYGPAVERAVDRSHMAMGELQKATLSHVFAMRKVLRPDQAQVFDVAVTEALIEPAQE